MAPKRPHDGAQQSADSGRARKKQKTAVARTIRVQEGSSAGAGVPPNSMAGLPSAIDVERFTEARSFEIAAMQSAIETAKGSATQRAWQVLPRSLRRRAASHDVRRVPTRLREKARAEMDPAKRKALGRTPPKRGKAKQITRTQSFLKRQRDKTWLETHIWHAKRMHMINLWGYRLAETPTEKSFRPSHRASVHGVILHDASYMCTISVSGKQSILEKMLLRCCDCQGAGPGAVRYTLGSRIHETHLYEADAYPYGLIAPITIIWKPLPAPDTVDSAAASTSQPESKKRRRGKGKEQETDQAATKPDPDTQRTLWMRFHPSAWEDVWDAVQKVASLTLDQVRKDREGSAPADKGKSKETGGDGPPEESIELEDLRSQINCFEIVGPRSTQVLLGALTLVNSDDKPMLKEFWSQLKDLQTPGSVPRGMVVGLKVHDPRLSFPPSNAKAAAPSDGGRPSASLAPAFTVYPHATLARSELWDTVARAGGALRPRFKKKDLDERRRQNAVPGTRLPPLRQDDRVPLLLVQHGPPHGWTLLLPQHWAPPLLAALTHTGARVAGLRERRTQAFEAGAPAFPWDAPLAPAYSREEAAWARAEEARWARTPPAKRVAWASVGTRSPWRADWEVVLGGEEAAAGLLPAQRDEETAPAPAMWLLRGPDAPRIAAAGPALLPTHIAALRARRGLAPLAADADLLRGALVRVAVHVAERGAPDDLAGIYAGADGDGALIGYVTTGAFSLARGRGHALGAVALAGLGDGAVRVKDRASAVFRAARVEVLAA